MLKRDASKIDPCVSVVICTKNRCKELISCLNSVFAQTFQSFEVIVVVDKGTVDGTIRSIAKFNCRVVNRAMYAATSSMCGARNDGIRAAKGKIVAFTDDDCVVDKEWLHHLISLYSDEDIGAVGGEIIDVASCKSAGVMAGKRSLETIDSEIPGSKKLISKLLRENIYSVGKVLGSGLVTLNFDLVTEPIFVDHIRGGNMSFRKELLEKLNGFDERFVNLAQREETDTCLRIKKNGYKILYNPKARVWHKRSDMGRSPYWDEYFFNFNSMRFAMKHLQLLEPWKFAVRELLVSGYLLYRVCVKKDSACIWGLRGKIHGIWRYI